MSIVNIRNVELLNNPARFHDEYNFRITFECVEPLKEDIEWKLLYVGDAKTEEFDQELDSCMVGPVPVGINSFDFTASAPEPSLLPSSSPEDILGVTVLILTGSYREKEFVRVGYYVNTEYADEPRRTDPPMDQPVEFDALIRNVLVEKPRVTRFNNPWDADDKGLRMGGAYWPAATTPALAAAQAQAHQAQAAQQAALDAQLDQPRVSSSGNPQDAIYQSPLPPPVTAAAPAPAATNEPATAPAAAATAGDVEMS